ncbi:MAG: YggT family protein [Thermomicrobiales bacterium]|nr:YggT family protein [Thermomicrobiales bacterium]
MVHQIVNLIVLLLTILTWAMVGRALLSWFDPTMRWPISRMLADVTEPVIAPIRQVVPPVGMIDLSFIVAIILIQVIQRLLVSALIR